MISLVLKDSRKNIRRHPGENLLWSRGERYLCQCYEGGTKKVEYHLHKGGAFEKVRR